MATVYAVSPPTRGIDISTAFKFGDTTFINGRFVYPDELGADNTLPVQFIKKLRNAAEWYNPDKDYVLLIGDHLQIAALLKYLGEEGKSVTVLRYSAEEKTYYPVRIT
jgi:hypothetical protein